MGKTEGDGVKKTEVAWKSATKGAKSSREALGKASREYDSSREFAWGVLAAEDEEDEDEWDDDSD